MNTADMSTGADVGTDVTVGDITSTYVISVERGSSLVDVASRLANSDVGFVIVDEGGSIAGVISERDVVLAVSEGAILDEVRAEDVMATDLLVVDADDSVNIAARQMLEGNVRHLIVGGREPGIVSIRDVLAAVVD